MWTGVENGGLCFVVIVVVGQGGCGRYWMLVDGHGGCGPSGKDIFRWVTVAPSARDPTMTFDELLVMTDLPPPGPELYAARRKLWLAPRQNDQRTSRRPSIAQRKLGTLLNKVADDHVWNSSIGPAWKRIATGAGLKKRIPMELMVCSFSSVYRSFADLALNEG